MALPSVLKDMMLFNNGNAYVGDATAVTPPKLVRKLEEHRAAGMDRPVKIDMGGEALEMEFTTAGPKRDVLRQASAPGIAGVMIRFVGSFENDETGTLDRIEITVRGRHEEIDLGEWKPGEKAEFKCKLALSYFRLEWNGREEIEIDILNMIERINGVDRLSDRRNALGL